jgi:hypothetical protein
MRAADRCAIAAEMTNAIIAAMNPATQRRRAPVPSATASVAAVATVDATR